MLKYSTENIPCNLVGTFRFKGKLKARIQEVYTEEIHVVDYKSFMTGDFSLQAEVKHVVEAVKEVVEEISTNRYVTAITPKGKKLVTTEEVLPKFCQDHKLDIEAVKLVLSGEQKTHKRWGFELGE